MSVLTNFNPDFLPVSLVTDTFIETGTANGDSLSNAIKHGYRRLVSIEICERSWLNAGARFGCSRLDTRMVKSWSQQRDDNLRDGFCLDMHLGSSPEVLKEVLWQDNHTTIYCDGHYCGNGDRSEMDPRYGECPLMAELSVIMSVDWRILPIIIIDDCHMFSSSRTWWDRHGAPFDRTQWPTFGDIYDLLGGVDHKYNFLQKECILYCWPNV